jgi:hypothetical protein
MLSPKITVLSIARNGGGVVKAALPTGCATQEREGSTNHLGFRCNV